MAKKSSRRTVKLFSSEIANWNFIIFLLLAFILLVVILRFSTSGVRDLRSRAGLSCPTLTIPRAEDCPGGWTYKRDTDGCLAFFCENNEQ